MRGLRFFLLVAALFIPQFAAADSADLSLTMGGPAAVRAGRESYVSFHLRNNGPDKAVGVTIKSTSDVANGVCGVPPFALDPGRDADIACTFTAPALDATVTFTASATSGTPDPDLSNNRASKTISVSTAPDLASFVIVPVNVDPGLPFDLTVNYLNYAASDAEGVTLTVDVAGAAAIEAVPRNCTTDGSTSITCNLGGVPPYVPYAFGRLTFTLRAPDTRYGGRIDAFARITSPRPDFNPADNVSGGSSALYRTFVVESTDDEGPGSLRRAIEDANAACVVDACKVQFRLPMNGERWATIRTRFPLPVVTANQLLIDANTQTAYAGDTNPLGPEVEINGSAQKEGDGLVIESACDSDVRGLVLNGFPGAAVRLRVRKACPTVRTNAHRDISGNYIGTDPTGTRAVPNLRGIVIEAAPSFTIEQNVISGNTRSALFIDSPNTVVRLNTIGLDPARTKGLGNGASGIFVSRNATNTDIANNAIAFNHDFGIAIERGTALTEIHGNSIHANWQPGIDIGLDGANAESADPPAPEITSARYDPQSNITVVEGLADKTGGMFRVVRVFANDAPDRSGYGQGQYYLGEATTEYANGHVTFKLVAAGDLRGKFVAVTGTRVFYNGWARIGGQAPNDSQQGFEKQTSEFSRTVEVK